MTVSPILSICAILISISTALYAWRRDRRNERRMELRESARFVSFFVPPGMDTNRSTFRVVNVGASAASNVSLDWTENDPKNQITPPSRWQCPHLDQGEFLETWTHSYDPGGLPTLPAGADWATLRWVSQTGESRSQRIEFGNATQSWQPDMDDRYRRGPSMIDPS